MCRMASHRHLDLLSMFPYKLDVAAWSAIRFFWELTGKQHDFGKLQRREVTQDLSCFPRYPGYVQHLQMLFGFSLCLVCGLGGLLAAKSNQTSCIKFLPVCQQFQDDSYTSKLLSSGSSGPFRCLDRFVCGQKSADFPSADSAKRSPFVWRHGALVLAVSQQCGEISSARGWWVVRV